jgi:integrase
MINTVIFKRKNRDGVEYFSARFLEDGTVVKTIALHEARNKADAARLAQIRLSEGIVPSRKNPAALDFYRSLWSPDSDYVRGRALRGVVLSEKHIEQSLKIIERHGKPYLAGRMADLKPDTLEGMVLGLSRKGLGARSVNILLQAIKTGYAYYCKINRLPNPLVSIEKVQEKPQERGILTLEELKAILALDENPRVLAAIALGAFCGLRAGEVRGLQVGDWADGILTVKHNIITESEGLKEPKWHKVRRVPMPAFVADLLKKVQDMPQPGGGYVIYNERRADAPIEPVTIRNGFHRCLKKIGIDEVKRKDRNLCFHGLRHFFITYSRSVGIPDYVVKMMAGHSDMKMTDSYSAHDSIIDFAAARASLEAAVERKAVSS